MFPKSKRFQDTVTCAPPVGSYNINSKTKGMAAHFTKSRRFAESKENLPGPCDTVSSYLDVSTCSGSSKTSSIHCMSTPKPKTQDKAKLQALERTIDSLKKELCLLREQNHTLQQKASVEENVFSKEDKMVATEDDLLLSVDIQSSSSKVDVAVGGDDDPNTDLAVLLDNKQKELDNLQMTLRYEQENFKADIDLERKRNIALKNRIMALENCNQEMCIDRDQVEDENKKLQGLADELRKENLDIIKTLDIVKQDLEDKTKKLTKTEKEGEERIQSLETAVEEQIMRTKAQEEKYAECIKTSDDNFSKAMQTVEELRSKNVGYENRIDDLEQRLVQATEQRQQANEDLGCLRAEKLSIESQLEQCHQNYEQKLQLSATQVEKLQEEIKSNQELMMDNFKSLTAKYTALEEIYDKEKASARNEIKILQATLEVTKTSLSNSKEEYDELISTFDILKNQLVEEQGMNNYLQDIAQDLVEHLFSSQSRGSFLEKELIEVQAAAQETKTNLENQFNKKQEIIDNLESEQKLMHQNLDILTRIEKTQNEKLSSVIAENESLKNETEKMAAELQHEVERYQRDNKNLKKEMQDMKASLEQKAKEAEERAIKIKEEFGRRLVETQKKLSQHEINQTRLKEENSEALRKLEDQILSLSHSHAQEKENLETHHQRLLQDSQDEIKNLREKLSRHSNDSQIAELKQQIEMWQNKYEELEQKVEPFKEQLDAFEMEKNALLSKNCQAQSEVSKLSAQYAKLLGHQNQKQKIHHVLKLKQENIDLKSENSKLREQCEKQKRSLKRLEEKMDNSTGKKRFNPAEAFSHVNKENRPLTVVSGGNASHHK